jgi:aminopeptidase N
MPNVHEPLAVTPLLLLVAACGNAPQHVIDPHSHARPHEAVITHLDLDIRTDFAEQRIEGTAAYTITVYQGERIVFDTDGLEILGVTLDDGQEAQYTLGDSTMVGEGISLGRPLTVQVPKGTGRVAIRYRTGPRSKALLWLDAGKTLGGRQPFLFTQGQAILTRTWIPVQDSPGIRFTYNATVQAPPGTLALMSATNPTEKTDDGRYTFRMEQPIPAYLIALAVGDLAFAPLGDRTGVYAEPELLEKAAWEFADTESMLSAAEALYGPYRWERYDVLVLPPGFPFGGMENPRLTFATPTIIAGDRSLTALIAHEMAHSWSGNLVTNATWNDFWLNEGFTVYFENRICEAVYGADYARMLHALGHQDLERTVEKFNKAGRSADTRLRLSLEGRDPDDGVSDIAYEKGFAFLRYIEERVGRERFDAFLRSWFDRHAFQSMTTDGFLAYLDSELLKPAGVTIDVRTWVDGEGIPAMAIVPVSERFALVDEALNAWAAGTAPKDLGTSAWTTHEWLHFLRHLPQPLERDRMIALDEAFGFTRTGNSEVLVAWLELAIVSDYEPAYDRLAEFLTTVGRRKFLMPLYTALARTEKGAVMAHTIYAKARPGYHAVAVRSLDDLLDRRAPVAF